MVGPATKPWKKNFNLIEDNDLRLFEELPETEKQRLSQDFEEYLLVQRKLFAEVGGKYSVSMCFRKIPNNKWVLFKQQKSSLKVCKRAFKALMELTDPA